MVRFGFKRKRDVLDLTEHYHKHQEKLDAMKEEAQESKEEPSSGMFGFLGNMASSASSSTSTNSEDYLDTSGPIDEKRKRLAKRIMDMTAKLEELTNQIYHLEQRLEVLERKSGTNSF
jgi:hypothetical protein